jgi:Xaa-Pro aminopeptidase
VCFTIVGSGRNAASPHHVAARRVIQPGDAVVVDIGGRLDGYCSDTTRTLVVGEPPPGFQEAYAVLHAAQLAGCAAVGPGVPAEAVDAACREVIAATASTSSTGPATASAWRSTRTPTWWPATGSRWSRA